MTRARKTSISSFSQKIPGPWLRKNSTWEVTKNLIKFRRSTTTWKGGKLSKVFLTRSLDVSIWPEIEDWKPTEDSERGQQRAKGSTIAPWGRGDRFQVVDREKPSSSFSQLSANHKWSFFLNHGTLTFWEKLEIGFSSPVSHLVFIFLCSDVYCSMDNPSKLILNCISYH